MTRVEFFKRIGEGDIKLLFKYFWSLPFLLKYDHIRLTKRTPMNNEPITLAVNGSRFNCSLIEKSEAGIGVTCPIHFPVDTTVKVNDKLFSVKWIAQLETFKYKMGLQLLL